MIARVRARGEGIRVRPITGAELSLTDGSHVTVLVETPQGYETSAG